MSRRKRYSCILIRPARADQPPLYAVNSPVMGTLAVFNDRRLAAACAYLLNEETRGSISELIELTN